MWRALVYIAVLCVVALGAVWLSDLSGEVTILLPTRVVNIDLPVAAALLILLGLLIALAWWLIGAVLKLPFRIGRASKTKRRAKGYQALSRGMIAVGSGDAGQARRYAREAQRLLGEEPLTLLLNAQVAQVNGDLGNADAAFRKMIANHETKLLGLRGLFMEARRQGDAPAAYRHAREAAELAPAAAWANEAVLEAQCKEGAWSEALEMIDKRAAFGLIDKTAAKRQRAVLLTADALAHRHNNPQKALADVLRALKYAPTLIPAAVLAGQLLGQRNDVRKAARALEKAWVATPHPDLAETYIRLRPGDSARDRLKRAETLGRLANWHPEARLAIAQAALEAREFKRAREVLQPLLDARPTIRTCLLMADIEETENGAVGHVREWVARAARAPRDPAWIADGIVTDRWSPFSPVSGHIDTFKWQTPPDVIAPVSHSDIDTVSVKEHILPEETGAAPLIEATATIVSSVEETPPTDKQAHALETPEKSAGEAKPTPALSRSTEPVSKKPEDTAAAEETREPSVAEEKPAPAETLRKNGTNDSTHEADEQAAPPEKPATAKTAAASPKPVVFPILHAPDDPGVEEDKPLKKRK